MMFPLVADQEEFGLLKGLYGSICPQGRGRVHIIFFPIKKKLNISNTIKVRT